MKFFTTLMLALSFMVFTSCAHHSKEKACCKVKKADCKSCDLKKMKKECKMKDCKKEKCDGKSCESKEAKT